MSLYLINRLREGKKTKCQWCNEFFLLGLYEKQQGLCKACYIFENEVKKID